MDGGHLLGVTVVWKASLQNYSYNEKLDLCLSIWGQVKCCREWRRQPSISEPQTDWIQVSFYHKLSWFKRVLTAEHEAHTISHWFASQSLRFKINASRQIILYLWLFQICLESVRGDSTTIFAIKIIWNEISEPICWRKYIG